MTAVMMRCGCASSATLRETGAPVCLAHYGISAGADLVDPDAPDLTGRIAECSTCSRTEPSSPDLPYFSHRPDYETDTYYSGCRGWD